MSKQCFRQRDPIPISLSKDFSEKSLLTEIAVVYAEISVIEIIKLRIAICNSDKYTCTDACIYYVNGGGKAFT